MLANDGELNGRLDPGGGRQVAQTTAAKHHFSDLSAPTDRGKSLARRVFPACPEADFGLEKFVLLLPLANTKRCESPSARVVQRMPSRSPPRLVSARRSGLRG